MTPDAAEMPAWLGNARIEPARDAGGSIIGVVISAVVRHEDIPYLPGRFAEMAHGTLDDAAARDARTHGTP